MIRVLCLLALVAQLASCKTAGEATLDGGYGPGFRPVSALSFLPLFTPLP